MLQAADTGALDRDPGEMRASSITICLTSDKEVPDEEMEEAKQGEEEPPSYKEEASMPEQVEFGMEDVLAEFELNQAEEVADNRPFSSSSSPRRR